MKIVFSFHFAPVPACYTIKLFAASVKLWLSFGGDSPACFVVNTGTDGSLYEKL